MTTRPARARKQKDEKEKDAAPEAPAPEEPPRPPALVPFKMVCQLICTQHAPDGSVVGEHEVAKFVLYESQFESAQQKVSEIMERINA